MDETITDVLIVGSGAAGLRAAIAAAEAGCRTLVISKGTPTLGSATLMSDGFFASSGSDLSLEDHIRMTEESGYHLNNPELVRIFCAETPERLQELQRRGGGFTISPGGMRAPKIRLGRSAIPSALERWAVEAGVAFRGWTTATDLLVHEGRIAGSLVLSRGRNIIVRAKATILCTGGTSALFLFHDNPVTNVGDGFTLASRAGANLRDMEFAQFYPFVTNQPGAPRILLTPPLSDVGKIINDHGEDLVEKYSLGGFIPLGVKARDRLSRALFQEHLAGRRAFVDLRTMTDADWKHPNAGEKLRGLLEGRFHAGITPVPVMPAAHFTMGGIEIDVDGFTGKEGLFAAGEATCGLHGANRMGGNALSETLVFGSRAGRAAAEYAKSHGFPKITTVKPRSTSHRKDGASPLALLRRLKEGVWKHCGPVRTTAGLEEGISLIEELKRKDVRCSNAVDAEWAATLDNALGTARTIFEAAIARRSSIGAHYREH
jgi:fumarate reductase (CoM/CoB) subunit A